MDVQIDAAPRMAVALPGGTPALDMSPAPPADLFKRLVLSFRRDVGVEEDPEQVKLRTPLAVQALRDPTPGMRAVMQTLAGAGATEDDLADLMLATGDNPALAELYYRLEQWKSWQIIRYTLAVDGRPLLTIEPMSPMFRLQPEPIDPSARYVLSRFAYCRRLDDHLLLESPLCHARIILEGGEGAVLIEALATPHSARDLSARLGELPEEVALVAMSLMAQMSVISSVDENGDTAEHADQTLRQWDFHDLLFHARSRVGRHDYPFGGRFRFLGVIPPLPAVKPKMPGERTDLYRPDIDDLKLHDAPFTRVLEERRSVREYGDPPISLRQLGEFLYRTARVRAMIPLYSTPGQVYEASNRPYPGGGAGYELELYLTVNTCADLPRGIYHYDPLDHQLCRVAPWNAHAQRMVDTASISAARICVPQVLVTFAARFQRMGWKYDSMAYAAILKNVGVLYQTMYLVATAMGLAPCGLGSGNSDLLAQAVGLDYLQESSVGEFMLGSRTAQ